MKYAICILATALLSYLWGSLNSAIIVIRLWKHEDIREKGSGNAGLTNVLRIYGKGPALVTLLCDLFKGIVAVVLARYIVTDVVGVTFFNDTIFIGYIAGLFVMLGHIFPLYYRFHGGKGVLLAATTLIAMDWRTCLISIAVCAATAYPLFTIITQTLRGTEGRIQNFIITLLIGALIIYMHKPNIKRLQSGTENKFGQKKKNPVENDAPADKN
jgi:glycerol-3-phosphate acyltransferase PlsY